MSDKPTVQALDAYLRDVVKTWKRFALYLPGIDPTQINIIELDNRDDVVEQKIALYEKWLQVYPNASWDDVIKALEIAEENTIAKQLREKYPFNKTEQSLAVTSFEVAYPSISCPNSSRVAPPIQVSTPTEEVTVPEEVVTELDALHQSFLGLVHTVESGVEDRMVAGNLTVKSVTRRLEQEQAFTFSSLDSVTKTDELFKSIRPHYNFLNCYLIVSIALGFLSRNIAEKATKYKEKIGRFMKTTKIRFLQNTLKRYQPGTFKYSNSNNVVEIVVENGWGDQNVWLVKMLVEFLFPVKHPDELPWYDIVPGSIVMTFIALEHMTPSLIESSRKKTEIMRLIGVISLKIGDELVWKKEGNKDSFSFIDSLIQATLAENAEAVKFLLQYTQVNVNTKNTTNMLNIDDEEIFYSQEKVKSYLKFHYTIFTSLIKDVEYNVQGMEAVANDLKSTSPVADNDKSAHRPYDNFLNGRVLADLANKLPDHLSTRVKQYQATINGITKRRSLLIHLSSSLEKYFPTPFPDSIEVILTLHSVWKACSVWYVEQLGQLIFTPTLFHKLQWFRVDTSKNSLRVVLLADKELIHSLVKECLVNDESLTPLLGVISVRVDETVVISNDYSDGYTFGEAIELAKAIVGNDEIADLLLQIQQSPVDFIQFLEPDDNNNNQFLLDPDSTPLMIACCNNNSQLVQLLLDHNADPNIQTRNSHTALMYGTGNSKIFQMLLDCGADIEACSFLNETVLYFACRAGNVKVVKTILAMNSNLVHIPTNSCHTPLMEASHCGHTKIVEMLLQAKADPNISDNERSWTALKAASCYGHTEIVGMLLQAKANPNIQFNEEWIALYLASRYGHIDIVRMLLQMKADPNIQDNEGWTPLQSASRYGHVEIVEMLLQAKAHPHIPSNQGMTALHLASSAGYIKIVQMLLEAEADPNLQDNEEWTALHLASIEGHTEIVRLLLQAKADPSLKIYNGQTALDLALTHNHYDVGEELCNVLFD